MVIVSSRGEPDVANGEDVGPRMHDRQENPPVVISAPHRSVVERDDLRPGNRRVEGVARDAEPNLLRPGGAGADNQEKDCFEGHAMHLIAR